MPLAEESLQLHQCRYLVVRAERAVRLAVTRRGMFEHAASVGAAEATAAARTSQGAGAGAMSDPEFISDTDALRLALALRPSPTEERALAKQS